MCAEAWWNFETAEHWSGPIPGKGEKMLRLVTVFFVGIVLLSGAGAPCTASQPVVSDQIPPQEPGPFFTTDFTLSFNAATAADKKPGGEECTCYASATCEEGTSPISCYDTSYPCTCSSVDQDCDLPREGFVSCDGSTQWCDPECQPTPPVCQYEGFPCTTHSNCWDGSSACADCLCNGRPSGTCICPY